MLRKLAANSGISLALRCGDARETTDFVKSEFSDRADVMRALGELAKLHAQRCGRYLQYRCILRLTRRQYITSHIQPFEMKIFISVCAVIVVGWLILTTNIARAPSEPPCTELWFSYLTEHYFAIEDGEGHGPDIGSGEWFNGFEVMARLPSSYGLPLQQRCAALQARLEPHIYIINRPLGLSISF